MGPRLFVGGSSKVFQVARNDNLVARNDNSKWWICFEEEEFFGTGTIFWRGGNGQCAKLVREKENPGYLVRFGKGKAALKGIKVKEKTKGDGNSLG
jgi:hypothetical protein